MRDEQQDKRQDDASNTPDAPEKPLGFAGGVSRRSFIQTLGVSAAASAAQAHLDDAHAQSTQAQDADVTTYGPGPVAIELRVNGRPMRTTIEPATTLMDALRQGLRMTGTKEVCDRGSCGGCSVLVDGQLVTSCMMLALDAEGAEITTIEGVADGEQLDPVQEAFLKHDALQCGYCTPGLVMASKALLASNPKPSLEEIKKGLSGNICRCGTYSNIFNAVLEASGQRPIVDATISAKGAVR